MIMLCALSNGGFCHFTVWLGLAGLVLGLTVRDGMPTLRYEYWQGACTGMYGENGYREWTQVPYV